MAAQIKRVFDDSIVNDLEPSDIGAAASPLAITPAASVQPSVSGTSFSATYTTTITGTSSRFLTQLSTANRVQFFSPTGGRFNGGLITSVASNVSAVMTFTRTSTDSSAVLLPLDTGSPTTGTTIITQTSNLAFSGLSAGNYYLITSIGVLGPYNMSLTDSDFALSFSYDAAYFNWATATSTLVEVTAGVTLVSGSSLSSGTPFYLTTDRIVRIAP